MNMILAASLVLAFCLNVNMVDGCMCLPRHPQKSFCSADFGKSTFNFNASNQFQRNKLGSRFYSNLKCTFLTFFVGNMKL